MRFTQAWHSFFDRSTPNVVLRLIVMLAGVAITSASVALTRATGSEPRRYRASLPRFHISPLSPLARGPLS